MNEVVDDCLVKFENFQRQYIIIPSLSLNPLLLEEKPFITVLSPPGFFNQGKDTRCYLNATFQNLYYNILFRDLVFKINLYTMMNGLERKGPHFIHMFQKIMIFRELQKCFGEIYLGGKKTISTDMFFFVANITTTCQMDAIEFEGMIYNMLSE